MGTTFGTQLQQAVAQNTVRPSRSFTPFRRQVNTTLAAIPLRRATSVTFAPGASASSTIRTSSSCDPVAAAQPCPKPRYASPDDLKARLKATCFARYSPSNKTVFIGRVHYSDTQG
jgi:hypothetical protein